MKNPIALLRSEFDGHIYFCGQSKIMVFKDDFSYLHEVALTIKMGAAMLFDELLLIGSFDSFLEILCRDTL